MFIQTIGKFMILRNCFLALVLGTTCSLAASEISSITFTDVDKGWNSKELVKLYFHNSETQRQWAWEILSKISWKGDEKVLDFASGDGKISAEIARLVSRGSVLGVDVSECMVHFAEINFPSYAFHNLKFAQSESITFSDFLGIQDCDIVTALTAFHLISNPIEVLKNLKTHLKPAGKLLLTIPTGKNEALRKAADEVFPKYGMNTPWNSVLEPSISGTSMRTEEGASEVLEAAGYKIESIELISNDNPFTDIDDLIIWHIGTASATWQIPLTIAPAFFTDLVNRMVELNPDMIDSEGRVRFAMPRLHIIASLPN
jgi:trans-aconitate 2-methyltransferase